MLKLYRRLVKRLKTGRRLAPRRADVPNMPADPKELARALFANDRKRPAKVAQAEK